VLIIFDDNSNCYCLRIWSELLVSSLSGLHQVYRKKKKSAPLLAYCCVMSYSREMLSRKYACGYRSHWCTHNVYVPVNRLLVAFSSHQPTIFFQLRRQVILFSIKPSSTERQTHQLTTMAKSWLPKVKVAGKSNCTVISKRRERDGRTQSPQRSLRMKTTKRKIKPIQTTKPSH
jgi:hypothetical protein